MKKKKRCPKCGKLKITTDFHKNKSTDDGLSQWCKKCNTAWRKEWYKKNRIKILRKAKENYKPNPEKVRKYLLKSRHGLTIKQYDKILKSQNFRCGICGKHRKNEKRHFAVDHNHKTKKIRGLLCNFCNHKLLGRFKDDKKKIEGFIKYFSKELNNDKAWK